MQIYDGLVFAIKEGRLMEGDQLPSINHIARDCNVARETVVKSIKMLQEKGIVRAVHGRGFFVASRNVASSCRIFLLLDTLSAYKEILFEAIKHEFGEEAVIDVFFHHFNERTFRQMVKAAAGNYTAYIILPFSHPQITEMLSPVPYDKLYLADHWPKQYRNVYNGVYQDFYSDIIRGLEQLCSKLQKYTKLNLIFRDSSTELPGELLEGFEDFCYRNKVEKEVFKRALLPGEVKKGEAYLCIDDNDLVAVVEKTLAEQWEIGIDIGILSYNDTPLKKVVMGGITVLSTNFERMGKQIAGMVLDNRGTSCIANESFLIDRGSF